MYLIKSRAWRPFLLLALLGGCAALDRALAPPLRPWPVPADGRIRREGRFLRVSGTSLKSREEADQDARRTLERWLRRLELDVELPERQPLIQSVLDSPHAKPVPSPILQATGFSSLINLDLLTLQKQLGTRYD